MSARVNRAVAFRAAIVLACIDMWDTVTDTGIVFVAREAEFHAIDLYRFSDQRTVRVGRLGFRIPGRYTHMTVSSDGLW